MWYYPNQNSVPGKKLSYFKCCAPQNKIPIKNKYPSAWYVIDSLKICKGIQNIIIINNEKMHVSMFMSLRTCLLQRHDKVRFWKLLAQKYLYQFSYVSPTNVGMCNMMFWWKFVFCIECTVTFRKQSSLTTPAQFITNGRPFINTTLLAQIIFVLDVKTFFIQIRINGCCDISFSITFGLGHKCLWSIESQNSA